MGGVGASSPLADRPRPLMGLPGKATGRWSCCPAGPRPRRVQAPFPVGSFLLCVSVHGGRPCLPRPRPCSGGAGTRTGPRTPGAGSALPCIPQARPASGLGAPAPLGDPGPCSHIQALFPLCAMRLWASQGHWRCPVRGGSRVWGVTNAPRFLPAPEGAGRAACHRTNAPPRLSPNQASSGDTAQRGLSVRFLSQRAGDDAAPPSKLREGGRGAGVTGGPRGSALRSPP